ncbi:hypothetical protein KIF59_07495 [Enterobacter cloacae subsp. cloacae]|nr:hypothetical protein [Enterobacter cloacae subsp. cloacae]
MVRLLENWGAACITPDERLSSQEFDLFLTDNCLILLPPACFLPMMSRVRKKSAGQLRVNFNISNADAGSCTTTNRRATGAGRDSGIPVRRQ